MNKTQILQHNQQHSIKQIDELYWKESSRISNDNIVEVTDKDSVMYGFWGYITASRIADDQVIVYFPVDKNKGICQCFEFTSVRRMK